MECNLNSKFQKPEKDHQFLYPIKIKLRIMHRKQGLKLWNNSPCCMNYLVANTSVDNIGRFQFGSIYHRDQVDKPKRIFNQFEKPDLLLQDFRRQIIEASHPKYNTAAKKNKEITQKQKNKARSMSMTTATKLYEVPQKIEYKYDIHGWRTHQTGDYNVKQIEHKVKTARKHFSFGRRIDLSRPLNFFPGPGTYDPEKAASERNATMRKTCMEFRANKNTKVESEKPHTERLNQNRVHNTEIKEQNFR